MGRAQVQPPPGLEHLVCATAGPVFPLAGTVPVHSVVRRAKLVHGRLGGFSFHRQVLACEEKTSYFSRTFVIETQIRAGTD